jgi:uncharacterized protein (TIGR02421 family)
MDCLLAVTPIDTDLAWAAFEAGRYDVEPDFHYRPLVVDPELLKRALHDVPIEDVQDPTLAALFRAKRRELDRQINLLEDRGTAAFLPASLQLYGDVDAELLARANGLLERLAERRRSASSRPSATVGARELAGLAEAELAHYRSLDPELEAEVMVREDVPGVLVSKGDLLVGAQLRVSATRADALLQHEVGTHVVTAVNGRAQPLALFEVGLPGYEETQEALAVLAEFVCGHLTAARLETLAARVIAVDSVVGGATFVETFRVLRERCRLAPAKSFQIAMRVHRAGGFTKDAMYLRGLDRLLGHLGDGNDLEPLLVGKLALEHVPVIQELRWREVLAPPRLRPRWLERPESAERMEAACSGLTVLDLVPEDQP